MDITDKGIQAFLRRIDTRLVRGFEELGVTVIDSDGWFKVDHTKSIIHITSKGKSLSTIQITMRQAGCVAGQLYGIYFENKYMGEILYE